MNDTIPLRLLVVDDEDAVRITLRLLLQAALPDASIAEAANGRQAVAQAAATTPDVVIMDIVMPGLNGYEATKEILAARPETKVLMFSGHRGSAAMKHAREAGAQGFVYKPCTPAQLVSAIAAVRAGQTCFADEKDSVVSAA
jgi:DNA-binding NarL/FixJ family response regulator